MNAIKRQQFIFSITQACEKDPSLVHDIIQAATAGIVRFASSQKNISADLAAKLSDIDQHSPDWTCEYFSKKDILKTLLPFFETSNYGDELKKRIAKLK